MPHGRGFCKPCPTDTIIKWAHALVPFRRPASRSPLPQSDRQRLRMPKAGVAQFSGSVNWQENVAAVRRLAGRAAEAGVNLLCFPELANTVYMPFIEDRAFFRLA